MNVAQLPRPKNSVPGQYLGYALQPVRLCHWLLQVRVGASVSLELWDDVAIHFEDGTTHLEQTKSSLSGNPASDRSAELWKTFANWAKLCTDGTVDPKNARFRYYVTPEVQGELVARLDAANQEAAAKELLAYIAKSEFRGRKGVGAEPHISAFLAAGPEICAAIVQGFEFCSEPDPLATIREKLQALIPPELLEGFCKAAIGEAKETVDKLIREEQTPIVDAGSYRRRFRAFLRKYNLAALLTPTTGEPSQDEIQTLLRRSPMFLQQLVAIDATVELRMAAVSDFLRTTADKINWAADGSIVENSLDELDAALIRQHLLDRDELEDVESQRAASERGRLLYRRCMKVQVPLEGQTLPTHFVPGAFNCLADTLKLGWHPDYQTMFRSE